MKKYSEFQLNESSGQYGDMKSSVDYALTQSQKEAINESMTLFAEAFNKAFGTNLAFETEEIGNFLKIKSTGMLAESVSSLCKSMTLKSNQINSTMKDDYSGHSKAEFLFSLCTTDVEGKTVETKVPGTFSFDLDTHVWTVSK